MSNKKQNRRPCMMIEAILVVVILGCGIGNDDAFAGYRQVETHQMQLGTLSFALESGMRHSMHSASFPEQPVECTRLVTPWYMVCSQTKNIVIDAAHPVEKNFDIPFALSDWSIRSVWGTVNYLPPKNNAHVMATVYGGPSVLYKLTIETHSSECIITIDPPEGPKGQPLKSCSVPVPQIIYNSNDLPQSPVRVEFEDTKGADGSILNINLAAEHKIAPTAIADAIITTATPNIPEGCTLNASGNESCMPWGTCESETTPSGKGYKTTFTVVIRKTQDDPQLAKCFALFPQEVNIEAIRGRLGYTAGGNGRASVNFWLYTDLHDDLVRCCDGDIIYGAKIAVAKIGTQCLIPDPEKKRCIIPIEGMASRPIIFSRQIRARKLTLWFNSDLTTAHPSPDKPDIIKLTIFFKVSAQ